MTLIFVVFVNCLFMLRYAVYSNLLKNDVSNLSLFKAMFIQFLLQLQYKLVQMYTVALKIKSQSAEIL